MIKLETKFTKSIDKKSIIRKYKSRIQKIFSKVKDRKAIGSDMTGWISYWFRNHNDEVNLMVKKTKEWQKSNIKDIVVIGIGGSYLGVRAGVDMIQSGAKHSKFNVHWIHNIHPNYIANVLNSLGKRAFGIVVISKSGNTLEPSIAFEIFKKKLTTNSKKANSYIVAITGREGGKLHAQACNNHWTNFIIPNSIGGRYSALTPVGMYLFILLGFDHKRIIKGAKDAVYKYFNANLNNNDAFAYACYRHYFKNNKSKQIENFIVYDPSLKMFGETYKQLFGESEGKQHKGLYPTTSLFSSDLHSMGQYLQDGTRNFFETTLFVKQVNNVSNKLLDFNKALLTSTVQAHSIEGKVDNLIIYVDKMDAYHYGYLYMFLCFSAMASAYLLGVNPFNQPGVEIYKKRMSKILNNK